MTAPELFSESNIVNTVAGYLAEQFITQNYLVYWHKRDAVQTDDGWYYEWSINKTTYLADGTFAADVTAAVGMVSFVDGLPADPRFVTRLISDASIGPADEVPVPVVSIELSAEMHQENYELGTGVKWRTRHLILDGYGRTPYEQGKFKDWFALWFEKESVLDLENHDTGAGAIVDQITFIQVRTDAARFLDKGNALTYQTLTNALIVYVA